MSYLVAPPSAPRGVLPAETFVAGLRERWPDAVIEEVTNPDRPYALDFELTVDGNPVAGSFGRDGQVMTLAGDDILACAEVAVWYRSQVPAEHPLVFYDQGYTESVPIEADADPAEVAEPFLLL